MIHPSSRTSPTSSDRIGRGFPGHSAGGSEVAETLAREALDMASATGILAGWTGGLGVSLETALTSASKQGKVEAAAVRGEGLSRSDNRPLNPPRRDSCSLALGLRAADSR